MNNAHTKSHGGSPFGTVDLSAGLSRTEEYSTIRVGWEEIGMMIQRVNQETNWEDAD